MWQDMQASSLLDDSWDDPQDMANDDYSSPVGVPMILDNAQSSVDLAEDVDM